MFWVILSTAAVWLIVNIPLFYSLTQVEGADGIAGLWGYAPNQFLFLIAAFPFAAFFTFSALHLLLGRVAPTLPDGLPTRWLYDNWLVCILLALVLACTVTCLDYFYTAKGMVVLYKPYAALSKKHMETLRSRIEAAPPTEQDAVRNALIQSARNDQKLLRPPAPQHRAAVDAWLKSLSPELYLQVAQDRSMQRRLHLVEPTLATLCEVQLLAACFVGFCALFAFALCYQTARHLVTTSTAAPGLGLAVSATFWAAFFFAFYSVCYCQRQFEIKYVSAGGRTLGSEFVVTVVLAIAVAVLAGLTKNNVVTGLLSQGIPLTLIAIGLGTEAWKPQLLRPIIGVDANMGGQAVLILAILLLTLILAVPQTLPGSLPDQG